jgi:hypothetical protein
VAREMGISRNTVRRYLEGVGAGAGGEGAVLSAGEREGSAADRRNSSGRDFAWLYERQDQVSFLDGHVRAFAHPNAP